MLPRSGPGFELGIGDDCAILAPGRGERMVFTTDLLVEGTHFTSKTIGSPRLLGRKSVAVNVSDVAAMGAAPTVMTVGIGAPPDTPEGFLKELYRGMNESCRRYGLAIVGGDTVRADKLCLTIAMLGVLKGTAPAALRSGAKPGQSLYVTGWPGESAAGLALMIGNLKKKARLLPAALRARLIRRHQDPTPRLEIGQRLRSAFGKRGMAMIDISDGLVHEACLLTESSGVGVEIEMERIPISPGLRALARLTGDSPLPYVLHGGEDYELLFALDSPPDAPWRNRLLARDAAPIHPIGRIVRKKGVRLIFSDGSAQEVHPAGFEHFVNTST
ncbi:MAG: thiamine-phosphate kinase [Candidatus Sumerlaeota bacterium]|nr:thiamine-phosphate kinase [Candidatus Sumerlaeota bacterium]